MSRNMPFKTWIEKWAGVPELQYRVEELQDDNTRLRHQLAREGNALGRAQDRLKASNRLLDKATLRLDAALQWKRHGEPNTDVEQSYSMELDIAHKIPPSAKLHYSSDPISQMYRFCVTIPEQSMEFATYKSPNSLRFREIELQVWRDLATGLATAIVADFEKIRLTPQRSPQGVPPPTPE